MTTTINGRTPEEIKRGLECCYLDGFHCTDCVYYALCKEDIHALGLDALAYIQQLERNCDELLQKNQQLKRERDVAVKDMTELMHLGKFCRHCKHLTDDGECTHDFDDANGLPWNCWQWRGVPQEVQHGTD